MGYDIISSSLTCTSKTENYMGFFKKITRPISRVLDKIIPNEIKPALPYLSAAAPFFGPTSTLMGEGLKRLMMGGGFNLASQLAQEGNEGEVNPLSLGLATLTAGMTDPGASTYLEGLRTPAPAPSPVVPELTGLQKFKNQALDLGIKGVDKLQNLQKAAEGNMLSKEGFKLASIPGTQGTMDLAYADQVRLNKQQLIDDVLDGLGEGFSNEDAANAIRLSMLQYGFSEDEITETIASAGYKAGGRVGKMNGGIMNAKRGLVDAPGGYAGETEEVEFSGIRKAVENSPMSNERVVQMYVSDSAGVIPLKDGDAVRGKIMDMMVMGAMEPYTQDDFRDPDGYERFMEIFTEVKNRRDQKTKELNAEGIKNGGIIGLNKGGSVLPSGREMDYRQGGMIPMGSKERADDVPARLSKNEFVMTADAVRAAGGGSVNEGAKRMYNLMNNLEARV